LGLGNAGHMPKATEEAPATWALGKTLV